MNDFENLAPIDCYTFLGNWAFRALRRNTPSDLVAMMDRFGIVKACVGSADAILHRDPQPANERLYETTRPYEKRFMLCATLNPTYPGWQKDLQYCVGLGFTSVRIYPNYHNYDLNDKAAGQLAEAVAEAGLCLSLSTRIEDFRQRHWLDTVEEVPLQKILAFVERHPRGRYLLLDAYVAFPAPDPQWDRLRALPIHFELSRMTSCLDDPLGKLLSQLGEDRVLFGTGFPFKTPSPAFLKIQALNADERTKLAILHRNAVRLFSKPDDE